MPRLPDILKLLVLKFHGEDCSTAKLTRKPDTTGDIINSDLSRPLPIYKAELSLYLNLR
jgi:hypothetical protein